LTVPLSDDPAPPRQPPRRFFSDKENHAIALERDQPGASVSQVAREHGIVTGMLFRWRVQFGLVAMTEDTPAALVVARRELVQR